MAFHWRIRHKLMLGLGLVVGIISLLLGGTLYGLMSSRQAMKNIESKWTEFNEASQFGDVIKHMESGSGSVDEVQLERLLLLISKAQQALDSYDARLEDTISHGRDPDNGFVERGNVVALRKHLRELESAARKVKEEAKVASKATQPLMEDDNIKKAYKPLMFTAHDLTAAINDALWRRSKEARDNARISMWIVISVSVGGVLLLCGLLRFFYGWVFYPIRDLEQGANRVAHGDFDHRINVHSGDEMQDLAAAFNDMTGRLQEMYRDLARQVNERSRQLVRSERLVSVGFLAAGVAHEINNPLASIAFCSEALQQRLADLLDGRTPPRPAMNTIAGRAESNREVVAKYLRMIHDEAFRCKGITERLLEFSRGGERSREETDLAEIVQSVLDMMEHHEHRKGKEILFESVGHVKAWVNAPQIKSVVLNLVANALDSMEDGGTLRITLTQREGKAVMKFVDTGCGMTEEVLENIFEPFFTRSRTGKGTGLGLSISHRVITEHGGEIEAVSPGLNQGSTFTVRLPLQPAETLKEESLGHVAA